MLESYARIIVTGGSGFIGRNLARAVAALGKDVVVVDRTVPTAATQRELPQGISFAQADIRDRQQVARALEGGDLIFHVAANANGTLSVNDPRADYETNAVGTFNIVEAALGSGAQRLVYTSSASVYGRPQRFPMDEEHPLRPFVPYGASKLAGELTGLMFQRAFGLPVVAGRPFCVYGPGENPATALVEVSRYLRWHLRDEPIQVVGDMDNKTRDFVHVHDLVSGLMLLAEAGEPGEMYNLGSGQEYSMRQLVDTIGEVTGQTPQVKQISEITDDTYRLVGDISKVRALGFEPQVSLFDGISDLAAKLGPDPEAPSGETIFHPGQHAEA